MPKLIFKQNMFQETCFIPNQYSEDTKDTVVAISDAPSTAISNFATECNCNGEIADSNLNIFGDIDSTLYTDVQNIFGKQGGRSKSEPNRYVLANFSLTSPSTDRRGSESLINSYLDGHVFGEASVAANEKSAAENQFENTVINESNVLISPTFGFSAKIDSDDKENLLVASNNTAMCPKGISFSTLFSYM